MRCLRIYGSLMRMSKAWACLMPFAAVSLIALSGAASAQEPASVVLGSMESLSCRDFASAVADDWAANRIERAPDAQISKPSHYVAIMAGKKYFVPLKRPDDPDLHLSPAGEWALLRARVYRDELARCLGSKKLNVYLK